MITWNGLQIKACASWPRMTLSDKVTVSDEFRKEMNEWMLEFFGTESLLPDGQVLQIEGAIWANPKTYAEIVKAIEAFNEEP